MASPTVIAPEQASERAAPHAAPHGASHDEVLGPGEGVELAALAPRFAEHATPWKQVTGYAGSLLLTFLSLWAAWRHLLPVRDLVVLLLALGGLQAAWQLMSFMHLREGRGSTWHLVTLFFGIGVGVGIVGFSIWIMTFKSGVS